MSTNSELKLWGKARIEALSDGVFAIAITLLVLDIRIADLPRHAPSHEVLRSIAALGPTFLSFLITFVLAGTFWYMHHVTFHSMRYITKAVTMLNLGFLMFVTLLPFSTSLIGRLGPNHPIAQAIYLANQLALGLMLNLLWLYARRHHLLDEPIPDPAMRFMIRLQPAACLVGLATIALYPAATFYTFTFVMVIGRRIARRRFTPLRTDAPAPL